MESLEPAVLLVLCVISAASLALPSSAGVLTIPDVAGRATATVIASLGSGEVRNMVFSRRSGARYAATTGP